MYWWTYYADAGLIGSTAQIGLPATERVLTAADGIVVSARHPLDRFWTSEAIVIRDFVSGEVLREIPSVIDWTSAVVVDQRVFWTGMAPWDKVDHEKVADAGVWTARIDGNEAPVAIIEPGKIIGSAVSGRRLEMSPSGRTIAAITASLGGAEWTDIIDVADLSRVVRVHDTAVDAITDDLYLVDEEPSTDGPLGGYGVAAREIETGNLIWRFHGPGNVDRFSSRLIGAVGSIIVIQYSWQTPDDVDDIIAAIDPVTGQERVLLRQEWHGSRHPVVVDLSASTDQHLLLAASYRVGFMLDDGDAAVSVLDVASGEFVRGAFRIDLPWVCDDDRCLEDAD